MNQSLQLPEETLEAARRVARAEGVPLEKSIARLIERRLRNLPANLRNIPFPRNLELDDWRHELL